MNTNPESYKATWAEKPINVIFGAIGLIIGCFLTYLSIFVDLPNNEMFFVCAMTATFTVILPTIYLFDAIFSSEVRIKPKFRLMQNPNTMDIKIQCKNTLFGKWKVIGEFKGSEVDEGMRLYNELIGEQNIIKIG